MENLKDKPSEGLASIIVAYRSLGLFKDDAKNAMAELMRRKDEGNIFDFEKFISDEIKKLPQPTIPNEALSMLKAISAQGFK